jgi:hypothetical protein
MTHRLRRCCPMALGLLATLLLGGGASAAHGEGYQETFDPGRPPRQMLLGVLNFGRDGPWEARLANGRYVLENRTQPGAVRYFFLFPEIGAALRHATVSVEVDGKFEGGEYRSGAGLIYRFDPERRRYVAFVVLDGGRYGLYQRGASGLQLRQSGAPSAVHRDRSNRLSIESNGSELHLLINSVEVGRFAAEGLRGSGVGIISLGTGRFEFDNFRVAPAAAHLGESRAAPPQTTSAPPPGFEPVPRQPLPPAAKTGAPRSLPADFHELDHSAGNGHALFARYGAASSARRLAVDGLRRLGAYFDGAPRLTGAIGDVQDREIQVLFSTGFGGQAVRGLLVAVVSSRGAAVGVVYDRAATFVQSLPGLTQVLAPHLPQWEASPASVAQNWHRVPFPDGSGSVDLPEGWLVAAANKGMADIVGPDGSYCTLGIATSVLDPAYGRMLMPGSKGGLVIAPYSDPVTALQQVLPQQIPTVQQQVVKIIEYAPVAYPGGQASYIHFDWDRMEQGRLIHFRALALVIISPGPGQWSYYASTVSSPVKLFARNLPTLMRIWESRKVAGHVVRERLEQARASLREIDNIIQQTYETRQASLDRIGADWTEVFRDQTLVEDRAAGERYDVPLSSVDDLVRTLNEAAGYERYRHVPLRELQ